MAGDGQAGKDGFLSGSGNGRRASRHTGAQTAKSGRTAFSFLIRGKNRWPGLPAKGRLGKHIRFFGKRRVLAGDGLIRFIRPLFGKPLSGCGRWLAAASPFQRVPFPRRRFQKSGRLSEGGWQRPPRMRAGNGQRGVTGGKLSSWHGSESV